ncbi:MAG: preprotein translocase subunit SecA [Spirochaetaceae bacterium]|nr:preprotein translocase subunit SecA [Spirochaetaceae bacterium]
MRGFLSRVLGSKSNRDLKALVPLVNRINELESRMVALTETDFPAWTDRLRTRLESGEARDQILPEAFALAREAARRQLGERIFDVQLMGGIILDRGAIVEMKTGEGKTLASVPAAYLNALSGAGVHVVTVNDYLAERDAEWMGRVHRYLGLSVGVVLSRMEMRERTEAYACDITYGTNNELGFDYLRDNMRWDSDARVQRGHRYCIVDEIDSILIDEARTPLIISGAAEDDTERFAQVDRLVGALRECAKDPQTDDYPEEPIGHYKIDEKGKRISFTDEGIAAAEGVLRGKRLIRGSLVDDENFEFIHYLTQALRAHRLFQRDVDYVIEDGTVQIVDEFTGRILHGRRYSDGLHQAIEAKERIQILKRNRTLASISFQNYFKLYGKLSGMTGTADTEATEFSNIYGLDVVVIPTNRPLIRADHDDVIFLNEQDKMAAICDELAACQNAGQPVLVGTVSIEKSEQLSKLLHGRGVQHEVLNAKAHAREALIIAQAGAERGVTIATNMAGRGTDIKLGGNPEYAARRRHAADSGNGAGDAAGDEERFRAIYERELDDWRHRYDAVRGAGGLHVLGTERHESRRIDNQLRGRSGRQGDPGSSRFYISLDDDLMRLFGENLRSMMSKVGMKDGEPLAHPWLNKSIARAQKRVEERNFELRKHLLDFDNVLNEQRKYIYGKRDEIMADGDLLDRVRETAAVAVEELTGAAEYSVAGTLAALRSRFGFTMPDGESALTDLRGSELGDRVIAEMDAHLAEKADLVGPANFNLFIRYEYLRLIDARWQDHLENLDALRDAVYLRTYSQKNPLLEYKLEGFQIFDEMLAGIRNTIAEKIFRVTIRTGNGTASGGRPARRLQPQGMATVHRELGQFAAMRQGDAEGTSATPARRAPSRRATPVGSAAAVASPASAGPALPGPSGPQAERKVGRNEPCYCGSGKKFKFCHGR